MARPRSDERRTAILDAATRVIASQGLGATTAAIAKEAGVSNGSVFVYFPTKVTLVNELYVELKTEMARAASDEGPTGAPDQDQLRYAWDRWLQWAATYPHKRRTIAQLEVSEDITTESHTAAGLAMVSIAHLLERCRAGGPVSEAPRNFVLTLVSALAEATIDATIRDPAAGELHRTVGFDAIWRVLAGPPAETHPLQASTTSDAESLSNGAGMTHTHPATPTGTA